MTSPTTKPEAVQPEAAESVSLFADWFDPIEAALRDRVRAFIETLISSELDAALARPRYAGTVRNFVCGPWAEHFGAQAIWKRSSNRIANCALAMAHSLGGILHSFSARFKTRNRSLRALSSVGK